MKFKEGDRVIIKRTDWPDIIWPGTVKFVDPDSDTDYPYFVAYDEQNSGKTYEWCNESELLPKMDDAGSSAGPQCKTERDSTKPITADEADAMAMDGNQKITDRITGMINDRIREVMTSGLYDHGESFSLVGDLKYEIDSKNEQIKSNLQKRFENAGWRMERRDGRWMLLKSS